MSELYLHTTGGINKKNNPKRLSVCVGKGRNRGAQ